MPITEILERNCKLYGDDVCLVEVNPEIKENRRVTWKEYELIESNSPTYYRREITWNVFNEKANRFANLLIQRGIKKGGSYLAYELFGMASNLFWDLENRGIGSSFEFPLFCR